MFRFVSIGWAKRMFIGAAILLAAAECGRADTRYSGSDLSAPAISSAPAPPQSPARPAPAPETAAYASAGWLDWNGDNYFGPCRGDCAFSVYGGKEVTTGFRRAFFLRYPPKFIWEWRWRDNSLAAATFSRRLVTFWNSLVLEPEFGIGQRFGGMHATELWAGVNIRWTAFPWNHYVKTSIGVVEGINFATKIDPEERLLDEPKIVGGRRIFNGSRFLNYFTPELTLALPRYPDYEILFRFHHRSGIFGLMNDTNAGAQFYSVGFRARF